MATSLKFNPILSCPTRRRPQPLTRRNRQLAPRAFTRGDFDGFAKRVTSGEALKDAWRTANDGFEQFLYESKKAAERLDRRYSVSRRLYGLSQVAADRARVIDRDLELTQRWRSISLDFSQNWPRYRKQFNSFLQTPLGKSSTTIFFIWFALSGWLFRTLIIATWVLPLAGPLLIGAFANNLVIKRACPACKRQVVLVGYKNETVRCSGCGNIVWQPQDGSSTSRGGQSSSPFSKSKQPDIIDVEFEEK